MDILKLIALIIVGLGIYNVWILRFKKSTEYRGGSASNLKEEFETYGLPYWFMVLIGAAKLILATALLAGIWFPFLIRPAAAGMAVLMIGAVAMHVKVGDPVKKSMPAVAMLLLSLFLAFV
jgi:hypothetical protein